MPGDPMWPSPFGGWQPWPPAPLPSGYWPPFGQTFTTTFPPRIARRVTELLKAAP